MIGAALSAGPDGACPDIVGRRAGFDRAVCGPGAACQERSRDNRQKEARCPHWSSPYRRGKADCGHRKLSLSRFRAYASHFVSLAFGHDGTESPSSSRKNLTQGLSLVISSSHGPGHSLALRCAPHPPLFSPARPPRAGVPRDQCSVHPGTISCGVVAREGDDLTPPFRPGTWSVLSPIAQAGPRGPQTTLLQTRWIA